MNVTESEKKKDWNIFLPFLPFFIHLKKLEFRSPESPKSWKPPPLHGPHVKMLKVSNGVSQPGRRAVCLGAEARSRQCFRGAMALVFVCPQQDVCTASSVDEGQLLISSSAGPGDT